MKVRPIYALTIAVLLVFAFGQMNHVFASETFSWTYDKINSATPTKYALSEAINSTNAKIYNNLVYNTTTTVSKAVIGFWNGSGGSDWHIDIVMVKDHTIEVVLNFPSYLKIANGTWTDGKITYVTISEDGDLTVKNGDTTILDDFNIGTFTVAYVSGSGAPYSVQSGYISLTISKGSSDTSVIVSQWMPLIITFAMLGVALGFIKKYAG